MTSHVAIIGGGFSGALQAINLHRHGGPRATLIERGRTAGEGLAFGAAHPSHVLNVRASNMSAFPDDPNHFVSWLERRGVADAARAFVPRLVYGKYLRELLDEARAEAGDRLTVVKGDVVDLEDPDRPKLRLADGRSIDADAVVLAVGNLPPSTPPGLPLETLPPDLYKSDPWEPELLDGLNPDATILILGTGLTMVDVVLLLEASGFKGRIVAMSRRGLLPHAHEEPGPPWQRIAERPTTQASKLVQQVRERSEEIGWRNAVDELRPFTQQLWRSASAAERARFLRHLRPWWDIHRHRLAPAVASELSRMQETGRLRVIAGKPFKMSRTREGIDIAYRARGTAAPAQLSVQRIVNCTGPQGDLLRTRDPLLRSLVDNGLIRPDAARLGIDIDQQGRTVSAAGESNEHLFAIGPMTRGAVWEIVAVPDIRAQTWWLARILSNAHWVGGEGL